MQNNITLKPHWGDRARDAYWNSRRGGEWPRMKKLHLAMLCLSGTLLGAACVVAVLI